MHNKVLLTFILNDMLFLFAGAFLLGFSLIGQGLEKSNPTITSVARDLLLLECPLSAATGNAIVVFVTFLISVPALIMPTTKGWLKLHGYMIVVCALFTLVLGLKIWFKTLKTRSNLLAIWSTQPASTQSLLQQELSCCGYTNSTSPPFVVDSFCSSDTVAAAQVGCVGPFSTFANNYLDLIFTGAFGIVGIDVTLILSVVMLVKDRTEKERYRHIDEKNGMGF